MSHTYKNNGSTRIWGEKSVFPDTEESASKQLQQLSSDDNAKFSFALLKPFATWTCQ
jgi:hypothetical protein